MVRWQPGLKNLEQQLKKRKVNQVEMTNSTPEPVQQMDPDNQLGLEEYQKKYNEVAEVPDTVEVPTTPGSGFEKTNSSLWTCEGKSSQWSCEAAIGATHRGHDDDRAQEQCTIVKVANY